MSTLEGNEYEWIESSEVFEQFCQQLTPGECIALDTEFVRTNTFYAQLGLIQLADSNTCYLVDPLPMEDDSALRNFIGSADHVLVIHSCSEDLNLLYTALNSVPAAIFDTQIAAAFLGLGFSLSYQALVSEMLGIDIPKDATRSDWLKRPLSDIQKHYAANDVRYLLQLRDELQIKLAQAGRLEWFEQECHDLLSLAPQSEMRSNWENGYASMSNAWRLNDTGLRFLQALFVWREEQARSRNKPRNWIAKDSDLQLIASAMSSSRDQPDLDALQSIAGVDKHVLKRYSGDFLTILNTSIEANAAVNRDLLNSPLNGSARKLLKTCQRAVQDQADELGIAPELLGRKKIITELVRQYELGGAVDWSAMTSQWRRNILEPVLSPILSA